MKQLLSLMLVSVLTASAAFAQTVQFTVKATNANTLEVYFKPAANIGPVVTGISNLTFVLQIPQSFSNPQGNWGVTPNSSYLGSVSTNTSTSTSTGSMYNTLFSWTSNQNIAGTTFIANTEYLLATITTPATVGVGSITMIDWGNNRLNNAATGSPLWATSLAIDGLDRTDNAAVFYGNSTTNAPNNSGATTGASTLVVNGTPLGIKLLSFSGRMLSSSTVLSWEAENEEQLSLYQAEYSANGTDWQQIGSIAAQGKQRASYSFTHYATNKEIAYYRLRLIEKNGTISYSKILSLKQGNTNGTKILVYPSAVTKGKALQVEVTAANGTEARITDANGKVIKLIKINNAKAAIATDDLASGTYFIIMVAEGKLRTQRFMVL